MGGNFSSLIPLALQGLNGDFPESLSSNSVSDLTFSLSLLDCSISLKASNLNLFLGARHIGDKEVRLDEGLVTEEDSDLESGDTGLGLRDSEL